MSSPTDIPAGFQPDPRIQPHTFAGLVGPFYSLRQGNDLSLGLRIEERHCNSRGTCHGGQRNFVTVDLSLQYLASTHVTRTPETENSPEN